MDFKQAKKLIQKNEGQRVEFKTSFAEQNEGIESLGAFANAHGGTVFFGVKDDGSIVGVTLGKKTLEDFANRLRGNTEPRLTPGIEALAFESGTVVSVTIDAAPPDTVVHAFGVARIRVGRSNQLMPPEQQRQRYFRGFQAQLSSNADAPSPAKPADESWRQRERRRIETYEHHRGLFLVHAWKPSSETGQVADIVIFLRQHLDGPLTQGLIKSVEYHLGPKFGDRTVVETNGENGFRLEVSAYGPFLCLARVSFDDGSPPLDLNRYIDF